MAILFWLKMTGFGLRILVEQEERYFRGFIGR